MRLLIFLLALTSAFFVSADVFDMDDLKSPKKVTTNTYVCDFTTSWGVQYNTLVEASNTSVAMGSCGTWGLSNIQQSQPCGSQTYGPLSYGQFSAPLNTSLPDGTCNIGGSGGGTVRFTATDLGQSTSNECPPDGFPEHKHLVQFNGTPMCAKLKNPECPAGHHSRAVSKALGSSECLPKECPQAGIGENLASTPMTGGVPFSGGGMYCNDGCAYSVSAEQISSDKYAVGTSQGAACGDKPYDNKKLADEGETGECSVSTGDVPLLTCPNANPTTPDKDPIDNDDSKVPEDETPEKPKETCADGDTACNLKNVETEIENSTNKQIDNDNELHNKQVDAATKNTNAILNALDSIDTTILLQTQQDERLHAVTVSKFNELVDAVNGIETGGGGGGGGNGNGNGSGGDCEGSPSECVPVEGAEIPSETVNLNQYADKYDDWLPNAELPSEKCIVLTNGKSICLSFEAFILLFQGISGLLVIGALMHSAKIISGAI